jgi:hypothetical protein
MTSSLEAFLPPAEKISYESLLHAYGKWWQAQPSLSGYPRHYRTATQHYLIVWEGKPGFYHYDSERADDKSFYNDEVKGCMIYFDIRKPWPVEVKVLDGFKMPHRWRYQSSHHMRASMLMEWTRIRPTLGPQAGALIAFINDNVHQVIALLRAYGDEWVQAKPQEQRHSLVYHADRYVYLSLWEGVQAAVLPRTRPDNGSLGVEMAPRIDWASIRRYSEARIVFKRLPVHMELSQRLRTRGQDHVIEYRYIPGGEHLRSAQELVNVPILDKMSFYESADRPDE